MTSKTWRGTALFAGVLTAMALTVGLRLYAEPLANAASVTARATPPTAASTPAVSPPASTTTGPAPAAPIPSPAAPAAPATTTVNGQTVQTPYGPLQVAVTFSGNRIVAVNELQAPTGGRSDRINSGARPILAQEVLASQSAHIDTVSGATYTSQAYSQSVQAAIDARP